MELVINGCSDDDLGSELRKCLGLSARAIFRAATIVAEMDRRKITVPLRNDFAERLREIAKGSAIPELFECPLVVFRRIATFQIQDQKLLVSGNKYQLVIWPLVLNSKTGLPETRLVSPMYCTKFESEQLLDKGHVRTIDEQISWLREQDRKVKAKTRSISYEIEDFSKIIISPDKTFAEIHGLNGSVIKVKRSDWKKLFREA